MKNLLKVFLLIIAFSGSVGIFAADAGASPENAVKSAAAEAPENNSVLATVNGEVVTLMDVLPLTFEKERQAQLVYTGERLQTEIRNYRKAAVDELIDNILIRKEFDKFNFVLSNQDIEREIDELALRTGCRSREQFAKRLKEEGSSLAELRLSVRKNMMVQLMLFRQLKIADPVSPKELYEYFMANENSFASPEKVVLAMLKLDSNRPDLAKEIVSVGEILKKDPEQFARLVKVYSPDLGSGELGEIERKQLRPEFSAAFKEFVPGMIAGPLKVYDGVVWLKVVSYTPAKKVSFHEVEARLKLELERKRREKVIKDYAAKLRAEALIEYYF